WYLLGAMIFWESSTNLKLRSGMIFRLGPILRFCKWAGKYMVNFAYDFHLTWNFFGICTKQQKNLRFWRFSPIPHIFGKIPRKWSCLKKRAHWDTQVLLLLFL